MLVIDTIKANIWVVYQYSRSNSLPVAADRSCLLMYLSLAHYFQNELFYICLAPQRIERLASKVTKNHWISSCEIFRNYNDNRQ